MTIRKATARTDMLRVGRDVVGWVLIIIGIVLALLVTILLFFNAAMLTSQIGVLLALALLGCGLCSSAFVWAGLALAQRVAQQRRRVAIGAGLGIALAVGCLLAVTILRPLGAVSEAPSPRSTTQYWDLPTSSRIAYSKYPALGSARPTPIIFLHGGPGMLTLDSDLAFYSQFANDGFDVYLYDQAGSGLSDPLPDIRDYTVSRSVADLEAIRQHIGAEQLVLIGHSWGSELAASYMAAYPQHVVRAIFHSPGPLWNNDQWTFDYTRTASEIEEKLPPLRIITVLNLFDRNPNAAERLVSQQEVNGWFDTAMEGSVAELFCKEDAAQVPRNISLSGTNLYANIGIQASANDPAGDPRPRLTTNQTPVLILYAECEYVPWEVALEYRTTFPQATLIYIDNAGHMINLSQPAVTYQVMRAFLLEESLPLPPYTESTPPG